MDKPKQQSTKFFNSRIFAALSMLLVFLAGIVGLGYWERLNNQGQDSSICETDEDAAQMRGLTLDVIEKLHVNRSLSSEEICAMSDARLKQAISKASNPKPDHPGEAVAFRLQTLSDENGEIPSDGYSKAAAHIDQMQANNRNELDGLDRSAWTWLGPGNVGGRVRSLVIHPANPSTMWAGSVAGGIWKTTDGGASWGPEDDFMANLAVSTLVMDPADSGTIYAGTGEGFYNGDSIRGAGVFKTSDGGATWNQLPATMGEDYYFVNRLAVAPDGSTLLAATRSGIFRSIDGGASWTQRLSNNIADIDFDPADKSKAVAGGGYTGGTWYSTDGGLNWLPAVYTPPLNFGARVELAYAPSQPNIVYASVDAANGQIWKSVDGGQNYSLVHSGSNYLGSQGWYDNVIWVDPTDPDTVLVGGIDLWRSTNGGGILTKISEWSSAPLSAHADQHAIAAHPGFDGTNNKTVFFGNDGGVYKTANVYAAAPVTGWQELNNNLGITQFYGAAGSAASGVIVGGTQDNGTLRYTGDTETWDEMFGGDGGWAAADPADPNYFYGEYVYLQIHRSTSGGDSAVFIDYGLYDAGSCANFIAPFILDPNNANTMLAGGCSLWRSSNVKASLPSWKGIKPALGGSVYDTAISAVAAADGDPELIWVGHNNGQVYKTINGTAVTPTWTAMDLNTPNLPDRMVLRITIDPQNHDIVYVTLAGFAADNVWRTEDGGATWSDASGSGATGLPEAPVRTLVIDPDYPEYLYAGTEVGIFASEDRGATWSLPHDGPANVSVDELFWMDNTLVAATHGRGLYQADLSKLKVALSADQSAAEAGSPLAYTIEVENRGREQMSNVVISDTIPANTTFIDGSATCDGGESGGVVTLSLEPINIAGVASCSFQVYAAEAGQSMSNKACVNADGGFTACESITTTAVVAVPRVLSFDESAYNVVEGQGVAVDVSLSSAYWQPVEVTYEAQDGTGTAGSDYLPALGTLTFDPGETTKSFTVTTIDDVPYEEPEQLSLLLTNADKAVLGSPQTATVTITDDEPRPTVQFTSSGFTVQEDAGQARVEVYLSGEASHEISVDLKSSDGTAAAGSDYTAVSATLTFAAGDLIKTFDMGILFNALAEADETVDLTLSNPAGADLGIPQKAVVLIEDVATTYALYLPLAVG